jgi:DNA-binding GntR family transcriptional regulator
MTSRSIASAIGGTVRQRTARELRDRILTGALRPGTRLDLDGITQEFGVSRTPVREALLELSFQGLVEIAPRSGVTVIGFTPAEALDSFALLGTLSGKAAEWATERITPEQLSKLSAQAEVLESAERGVNVIDANWQFHRILNEAASSKQLLSMIRQAVRFIPSNFLAVIPVHPHDGNEHAELLDHVRSGRAVKARIAAERHVLLAGESLAAWLTAQAAATSTSVGVS